MPAKPKTKLELTWIGKENRPRLEPRILLEDPEKSCHATHRVTDHDLFDNRLIFGDNLLALRALKWLAKEDRMVLFDAQDDIDRRRGQLIAAIEGKLQQRVSEETLFSIRWALQ